MARVHERKHAAVTTGAAGSSGIPCAMGYGLYVISPGTGLFCPRHPRDHRLANLTPASGRQDHTISPSAPVAFVARARSVHRIPASRVVTIAIRPLHRGGMAGYNHIFLESGREIFSGGTAQAD